ncbi:hypothetical protein D3C78_17650 [compost metagenome]
MEFAYIYVSDENGARDSIAEAMLKTLELIKPRLAQYPDLLYNMLHIFGSMYGDGNTYILIMAAPKEKEVYMHCMHMIGQISEEEIESLSKSEEYSDVLWQDIHKELMIQKGIVITQQNEIIARLL